MPDDELDWNRLAEYVYARRRSQGFRSREVFAAKAGVSTRTLGDLERGKPVSKGSLLAVDSALMWVAGSCDRILRGQDPHLWPQHSPGFWQDGDGEPTVTEENPQPSGETTGTDVGPDPDAASYVAHPGERTAAGLSDEEVLALIRESRRLADELERRIAGESP